MPVDSTPAPTVLFCDSHMHTTLCKHAWGEPEEYAEQALKMGLDGIIFTCHSPMPDRFWPGVRMSIHELDEYFALVERCRERFAGQLEVRLGMESDFFPGMEPWVENLHQKADFQYILGSVHWQGPEYRDIFNDKDEPAFRRSYFENLAKSAETGLFDCLAHPDLIKNYQPVHWRFFDWREEIAAALDRIAKTGVAMELNTSGLNKSYSEMNPSAEILAMMAERGIPVVLGSDSHVAKRVGDNFIKGLETIREAGFAHISVFKNRRRQEIPVEKALEQLKKAQQQA